MNKKLIPEISIFFPCYNEEKNISTTFHKALSVLNKLTDKWEIILVNDGSKDKTAEILTKLHKEYPQKVKIITHSPNRGYGAAFKSGVYNSQYDWIAFTDADGQFDFAELEKLITTQKKTDADLVIGYYLERQVPGSVILTSKIWELIVYVLFGLKVRDIDCGFKLFSKNVVDTIPKLEAERGAFISSEFLIKSKKAGFKISEIGVHHYPRIEGQATGRKLNVILKSFSDLLKLWFKINLSK